MSEEGNDRLSVIVTRNKDVIDHIFIGSVALLVSILYINFGAALDLDIVKNILVRPIGLIIGFIGQFILMPLISYTLGHFLFPKIPKSPWVSSSLESVLAAVHPTFGR